MMFLENVRLALFSLKANKMRALLTMLGIIIGISSVIAIMTVGNSLTASVTDEMSSMGANNISVFLQKKEHEKEVTEEGYVFEEDGGGFSFKDSDYISTEMIKELCDSFPDEIYSIAASTDVGQGQILEDRKYANVTLKGASVGEYIASNVEMTGGRFFTEKEMDEGLMLAICSDKVVDNMFEGDSDKAIGSTVNVYIGDKYYQVTIIGIYKYDQSQYSFSSASSKDINTTLYIPLKAAQKIAHSEGLYSSFTIVTKQGVDPDKFAAKVESFFATYYRNNRNITVAAFSLASMVEMLSSMLGSITKAIAVVAGIALLVGGIGVMNIMLVSITERTREIGTRKALGAPNSSIRMQFIIEAVVICIIGGIIGILIGVGAGVLLAKALGTPASPSIFSIVLSLSFSMIIGVFFGYYPANKAAKMDPIEALRYE